MRILLFPFMVLLLGLSSCKKELSAEEQLVIDIEKINQYLSDNNLMAQSTDSGLHYIITEEGSGGHPTLQSTVSVRYKGYFLDGLIFNDSGTQTITFKLSDLITGWQEGIPLLQKGGKGTFLLPSALAYGTAGKGSIGPNTVLIFEIELVNF